MRITELREISASPYKTKAELAEAFGICGRTVKARLNEIEEEVKKGRYPSHTILRDGSLLWINQLVWIDYLANRQKLINKNARKFVPPYDPGAIAREIGWYADIYEEEGEQWAE